MRAHAPDQPAMTAAMITRRPMGIVSFLRSKVVESNSSALGKNDSKTDDLLRELQFSTEIVLQLCFCMVDIGHFWVKNYSALS